MANISGRDMYRMGIERLYSVESQIVEAMPKMIKTAKSPELRQCLELQLQQTKTQRDRLIPILERLNTKPGKVQDKGFAGLLADGDGIIKELSGSPALDAGIIVSVQLVEHYEIALYGSAVTFAQLLGRDEDVRALKETLGEEEAIDKKLTQVAAGGVNAQALKAA